MEQELSVFFMGTLIWAGIVVDAALLMVVGFSAMFLYSTSVHGAQWAWLPHYVAVWNTPPQKNNNNHGLEEIPENRISAATEGRSWESHIVYTQILLPTETLWWMHLHVHKLMSRFREKTYIKLNCSSVSWEASDSDVTSAINLLSCSYPDACLLDLEPFCMLSLSSTSDRMFVYFPSLKWWKYPYIFVSFSGNPGRD